MEITRETLLKQLADISAQELGVRQQMEVGSKLLDSLHGARSAIEQLLKAESAPPPKPEGDSASFA